MLTLATPTPVKRASSSSCLRGSRLMAWLWSPSIMPRKKAYKQWMNRSFMWTSLIELRPHEWRLEGQHLAPCFPYTVHIKHSSIWGESGINILTVSCFSDVGNSSAQHLSWCQTGGVHFKYHCPFVQNQFQLNITTRLNQQEYGFKMLHRGDPCPEQQKWPPIGIVVVKVNLLNQ